VEWIKIFPSEAVARTVVQEHVRQLMIVGGKRICLALLKENFLPFRTNVLMLANRCAKEELITEGKSFVHSMDSDLILMVAWPVTPLVGI
jgi:hypothetical protein